MLNRLAAAGWVILSLLTVVTAAVIVVILAAIGVGISHELFWLSIVVVVLAAFGSVVRSLWKAGFFEPTATVEDSKPPPAELDEPSESQLGINQRGGPVQRGRTSVNRKGD